MTASFTTERGPVRQKAASPSVPEFQTAPLPVAALKTVPANLAVPKTVSGFAVGDIYLAALPDLSEVEIEDIVPAAQAVKIKGRGWIEHPAFEEAVKAKLGRAVYTAGLLGLKRKFIRET